MKLKLIILLFCFLSLQFTAQNNRNVHVFTECATNVLMNGDIDLFNRQYELDVKAYNYFTAKRSYKTEGTTVTVPVVVHIIHNGGIENISNAQVQSAINNINSKLVMSNNYQIQLCLAQRDPLGNSTNGITRDVSSLTTETMETDDISLKNINRWSPTCYLNIWIVRDINSLSMGSGVIGYSSMPASHGTSNDGIVIEAAYFGSSPTNDCVGTHELGHYFGLYHTFENACTNNNCLFDGDKVCDTPPDQTTFSSCVPSANSCSTDPNDPSPNNPFVTDVADLSDDYMDYSSLSCYTQFTAGQYSRMQYFLSNIRYSLLNCLSCVTPCPAPVTATITSPVATTTVTTGSSVNFTGTSANSTGVKWYLTAGTTLGTANSLSQTFNTPGIYWMKFKATSGNTAVCLDGLDSVQIIVIQPAVSSCTGALQITHSNDAVHLPTSGITNQFYSPNGFTWECWVKLTAPFSSYSSQLLRPMISFIDNTVYEDMCLSFGWSGGVGNVAYNHLCFKIDGPNGGSGPSNVSCDYMPSGGFSLNTWYHVAATMDYTSHTAKLYLNGSLVDTKTVGSTPFSRLIPGELGWDVALTPGYPSMPLGGYMDEVRIWSKVRTPSEISTYYNQCLAGNEPNLVIYYKCNQTAGTLATDATSYSHNGMLVNQIAWSTEQAPLTGPNCSIGCANICPPISAGRDTFICSGNSIQLNATPGFTSYTWTPATGLSNANIQNPVASPSVTTTYIVSGTTIGSTSVSCISQDTIKIKISQSTLTLNLGPDISLCSNGVHVLNAGNGFYSYLWNDGSTGKNYTAFGPGKYWVTATDSCGVLQSDTINISLAPTPALSLMPDTLICAGSSTVLNFTPAGVFSSFQWSPLGGLSCTQCANPTASPTISTMYHLAATTSNGCTVSDSVLVTVNTNPPISLQFNVNDVTCSQSNGVINITGVTGGTPGYQYSLDNSLFSTGTAFANLDSGTYVITVRDTLGCVFTTTTVIKDKDIKNVVWATTNSSVCEPNGVAVLGYVDGGTAPYLLSFNSGNYSGVTSFDSLFAGSYPFLVKDSNNCVYSSVVTIRENPEEESTVIPNCFTPNNDQINETWFVSGNCIGKLSGKIYDRWGVVMYTLTGPKDSWDGKHKDVKVPGGVYFYVLDLEYTSGNKKHYYGSINLIR